jgi:hypothetical protein
LKRGRLSESNEEPLAELRKRKSQESMSERPRELRDTVHLEGQRVPSTKKTLLLRVLMKDNIGLKMKANLRKKPMRDKRRKEKRHKRCGTMKYGSLKKREGWPSRRRWWKLRKEYWPKRRQGNKPKKQEDFRKRRS